MSVMSVIGTSNVMSVIVMSVFTLNKVKGVVRVFSVMHNISNMSDKMVISVMIAPQVLSIIIIVVSVISVFIVLSVIIVMRVFSVISVNSLIGVSSVVCSD